jgi:hypothetical protein
LYQYVEAFLIEVTILGQDLYNTLIPHNDHRGAVDEQGNRILILNGLPSWMRSWTLVLESGVLVLAQ